MVSRHAVPGTMPRLRLNRRDERMGYGPVRAVSRTDFTFAKCAKCGSIPALQEILAFDRIQQGDIEIFLRQCVESTAGLWEMFWPVASLASASSKSLLDVGCGFGFTADAWKTVINPRAFGCDPAPYAAAGRKMLGEHIFHALLDDVAQLAGERFVVVYSSEVIEHVPDPDAFVRLLRSRLASGGTLVLTTPAADFILPTSDPGTTSAALAAGFHGFLFSRDALKRLLYAIGFTHVLVEHQERRPGVAYAWCELALASTQKLCGLTVLSGLEAAAFYWQAMLRVLTLDINAGRPILAVTRLLACIEALVEPEPLIGGGAPPAPAILQMVDGWTSSLMSSRNSVGLLALSDALSHARPKNATASAAVAFRDLCNLAAGLALFCEALVRRDGSVARDCLARLRQPTATQHHVVVEWLAALYQRLNTLESLIPVANVTSFAAAPSQYRWNVQSTLPKRLG